MSASSPSHTLLRLVLMSTPDKLGLQVAHVKAERNVLAEVQNQYIVKLHYSFQVSWWLLH